MSKKSVSSKVKTNSLDYRPAPTGNRTRNNAADRRLLHMLAAGSDKDHHQQHGDNAIGHAYRDTDTSVSLEYGTTGRRDHQTGSMASHGPHILLENTYRLHPQVKFDAVRGERLVREVVRESLAGRQYNPAESKTLCQELSKTVLDRVKLDQKNASVRRYKYVVTVSIGSVAEHPGIQFSSRSLWSATTDDYVSVEQVEETMYALVVVYAVYFE